VPDGPPVSLRLTASALTRVLAVVSPSLLVGLGLYGVAGSWRGPGPILLALGVALTVAVVRSIPWSSEVGEPGVEVRMPGRRVALAWDDVVAFERHKAGRKGNGALVVRDFAGNRTALTDVAERPAEWDTLRELVARYAPGVAVSPPPPGHPFLGRGNGS
jgi:hypothetical protein